MSEQFQILTDRDHVRQRPNMYLGSTSYEEKTRFINGEWKTISYIPALIKMIDEIIDNSIDEAIRTNFKYADKIYVDLKKDDNCYHIHDNGRGIPLDEIHDQSSNQKVLRPVAAWTKTKAGSNFDDDERLGIGMNGVGSSAVNFMSEIFVGETSSNNKRFRLTAKNGCETFDFEVKDVKSDWHGTHVKFKPDISVLDVDQIDEQTVFDIVEDRLKSLSIAFPKIKFYLNRERISSNIKDYASQYLEGENQDVIVSINGNISYFVTSASDGHHNSFVNGVNVRLGGTYVDHIFNNISDELSTIIKKKHKIEISRNMIKNGLNFVLFVNEFQAPKFDSQTKERLTNSWKEVSEHWFADKREDFAKVAMKIFNSEEIIQPIIEAQLAKKLAADKLAAKKAQKNLKKIKVAKHVSANTSDSTLFLVEGDSALGFSLKVRNPDIHGFYPLRGKVMNTWDMKPADVLKNKELSELIAILGLDINDPDSVDDCTYRDIAILTDADMDGHHIGMLLLGFFYRFWPRFFDDHKLKITKTPIMISAKGKDEHWFYSYKEAKEFKNKNPNWTHRYLKGLASLKEDEYRKIINEPQFNDIEVDNNEWFEIILGNNSEPRKEWLLNV